MENIEFLWVEEYRPQNIDDCILPQTLNTTFSEFFQKLHCLLCYMFQPEKPEKKPALSSYNQYKKSTDVTTILAI